MVPPSSARRSSISDAANSSLLLALLFSGFAGCSGTTNEAIGNENGSGSPGSGAAPTTSSGGSGGSSSGGTSATGGGSGGEQAEKVEGLRGAFLQVTNSKTAEEWQAIPAKMAALGMQELIIQTEAWLTEAQTLNAPTLDRLTAVLDGATQAQMHVYIGLVLPEYGNGSLSFAANTSAVDQVIAQSKTSVDRVISQFGDHQAFAGWYIPLELWTPSAEGLHELPRYVDEVSAYAKSQRDLPIVISPFISDLASDPALTTSVYTDLLQASDVDIVALQDGVGARNLTSNDLSSRVTPYALAMEDACANSQVQFWLNLEAFDGSNQPASAERFAAQLALGEEMAQGLISYEFSTHFLNAEQEFTPLALSYQSRMLD